MTIPRKSFAVRRQSRNRILSIFCLLLLCTSGILAYCYHRERSAALEIQNERDALRKEYDDLKMKATALQAIVQNLTQMTQPFTEMIELKERSDSIIEEQHSFAISTIDFAFSQIGKYNNALMRYDAKYATSILSSVTSGLKVISDRKTNVDNAIKRYNEDLRKFDESVGFLNKKLNESIVHFEALKKTSQP